MTDALIRLLEALGYPVYRQGSVTQEYPDSFFTFWNTDSPDHAHYDNQTYGTAWAYMVNFYSVDPDLTYSVLELARTSLKAAGWIVDGQGYDVNSDEPTHTGRGLTAYFLETEQHNS